MNIQHTPRTIKAFNTAAASENRIHDDATAQRFGFTGALVPGVEVYAYMCHLPVARWGRAFLESGTAECRFFKPVYDGDQTTILATGGGDENVSIRVESRAERCADGLARPTHDEPVPEIRAYRTEVPKGWRPPAGFDTLPVGGTLGIEPVRIDAEALRNYLRDIREDELLYEREGLVHPGQILRLCNAALVQNVVLGPWIHVGSRVRNFRAAQIGEELTLRGVITSNTETKGHAIVTFDAVVLANETLAARIEHVAIWRPRQVAQR